MGRTESKEAFKQSSGQSAQDQANAQASLASTNKAVGDYNQNLERFTRFGRQTYGPNGEFMKTQNTLANTSAAAGSRALGGDLALHSMRTGENTAGFATAAGEDRRARQRDLTTQLATADATRLDKLTALNGIALDASKFPASVYGGLYGTGVGGANNAMGNATSAAKTPGFWDTFLPALAQGAGAAAGGFAAGCWVAEAIYGIDDPRTHLVRFWLNTEFKKQHIGRIVMALYLRFGQRIAKIVRASNTLKNLLKPLFDIALHKAMGE
jgi:hypothetical protein